MSECENQDVSIAWEQQSERSTLTVDVMQEHNTSKTEINSDDFGTIVGIQDPQASYPYPYSAPEISSLPIVMIRGPRPKALLPAMMVVQSEEPKTSKSLPPHR